MQAAGVVWGACTESQCKEYLLRPEQREALADQHGAVRQAVSGLAALKHMTDRSFLCMHFHMDKDHTLMASILTPSDPTAGHQIACQGEDDIVCKPEQSRQMAESGRIPSSHSDVCR